MLEPVLAGALLAIVVLGMISALVIGRQSFAAVADRTQALYIADEGLEALRTLRDNGAEEISPGTWGVVIDGSTWMLDSAPDITAERFSRTVTIAELESGLWDVSSRVTWDTENGEREVVLQTMLADWR